MRSTPSFVKSVTFDCREPLVAAARWAEALGSHVDEDSTPYRAWVGPAGWGGPSLWFRDLFVMADPEGNEFCLEP